MIDEEWIESLKNDGKAAEYIQTRSEIIDNFIEYYKDFSSSDDEY